MIAGDAGDSDASSGLARLGPEVTDVRVDVTVHVTPRLGRGIVWSDVVAEIERDQEERMRDAA
jgi:hypothetical protein